MRANDVLGLIQAQAYDNTLRDLTSIRTMGSVPFGCRYRFIDFPLSNMVNAGITTIGIVTRDNYQSLMDHVGSGKPWDLARKNEGLFLLPPYNNSSFLNGTNSKTASLWGILEFLKRSRQDYVVITDANAVYNFDFKALFDYHTEKGADITVCYKNGKPPKIDDIPLLTLDEDARLTAISSAASYDAEANYYFFIAVMKKSLLMDLLTAGMAKGEFDFSRDLIGAHVSDLKIYGYEIPGFAEMFDSLQKYYDVNMSLLKPENRKALLPNENPISTKISDNVPAIYGEEAKTSNSLIADGCVIDGTVENSLLFRGVVVEKGAVVKNSILMQGTVIHAGARIDSLITDKNVSISAGRNLSGDPTYPIYITKNVVV